jgi:hypothetical protein
MSETEMKPADVERNAQLIGLHSAADHSQSIVALLAEIRQRIATKASGLKQDAPLAIYFDAR